MYVLTGEVKVWLDGGDRVIDREMDETWELIFRSYDSCEGFLECEGLYMCHQGTRVFTAGFVHFQGVLWQLYTIYYI